MLLAVKLMSTQTAHNQYLYVIGEQNQTTATNFNFSFTFVLKHSYNMYTILCKYTQKKTYTCTHKQICPHACMQLGFLATVL